MSTVLRSARHPWVRSGFMGLVPLLLPFVWVLEVDSCGHPVPMATELTGTMLIGKLEVDAWAIVLPAVLLAVLTPWLAHRVAHLGLRVLVHVLGLAASLFTAYCALLGTLFSLFTERVFHGVGWLVIASFGGAIIDAVLRVIWSTQEWLRARALSRTST